MTEFAKMSGFTEVSPNYFTLNKDSPKAKLIAEAFQWYSPKFSPKDVPRFYDVSSLTEKPEVFSTMTNVIADRYRALPKEQQPTHIIGYDARGFIIGAPLAVALGLPFVLLRKAEKSPGLLVKSDPYAKEYTEKAPDTMVIRQGAIDSSSRVVLIDDLIATGGTAVSGFQLVEALGAKVVEFCACIGIPFLDGVARIHAYQDGKFKNVPIFTLIHDSQVKDENCGDPKEWDSNKSRVIEASNM